MHILTGIFIAFPARQRRRILHAHKLDHFEAVERESRVRHHAAQRRHEATVQGAHSALVAKDRRGRVYNARVLMFARHLEGEPRSNRVQRIGEGDRGESGPGAGHEFVRVLDVQVGRQYGGEVLYIAGCGGGAEQRV